MDVVGISALTHDSGVAHLSDGDIISAINNERLTRKKLQGGFPKEALNTILKTIKLDDVDHMAVAINPFSKLATGLLNPLNSFWKVREYSELIPSLTSHLIRKTATASIYLRNEMLLRYHCRNYSKKLVWVDHHLSHAASAYYTSGVSDAIVFTLDKFGDLLTGSVYLGEKGELRKVDEVRWPHSAGAFYAIPVITLGFKPRKHAGKITGLAAYGTPPKDLMEYLNKVFWYADGRICSSAGLAPGIGPFHRFNRELLHRAFFKRMASYTKEDLSAAFQKQLEDVVIKWVKYHVERYGFSNVCLAGGIFANVKVNQGIHELEGVKSIFVHPHMGDGGTGSGAALQVWAQEMLDQGKKPIPKPIKDVYLGLSYSDEEIEAELRKAGLSFEYCGDIEGEIAELLSKGKVVARFNGRMEYGPRALGNRSILYQANDPSINDWLNERLKRTEFMPFAPVTLREYADECYLNMEGALHAAKFMTIAFDCTEWMKKSCPGVVHVDGTARPQLISREDNLSYYRILEEYMKITGLPSIINTSFNMHEEPIVCSPYDAIRSFKAGHLDYLAIGNYLTK